MNIVSVQYTLNNLSMDIYLSGCTRHCKGCHNYELWDFKEGTNYLDVLDGITQRVKEFDIAIDNIMLLGGEPLDQDKEDLLYLTTYLYALGRPLWLFTGYEFKDVPTNLLRWYDYIKCGDYKEELACKDNIQYGISLATSNQKIYKKGVDYLCSQETL